MVIGTAKNDVAYAQQFCSSSVGELGLPRGNPCSQTHAVNMVFQHVDLGATGLSVESGRAVEAIEIRLRYGIGIYQEQPSNPGSREQFDDRTTSTATPDHADAELLESRQGTLAYRQSLPMKEPVVYSSRGFVFRLAGVGELGAQNAHGNWLRSSFRVPNPRIYPAVTPKENTDQNLFPPSIPTSKKVSEVRFVLVILMRKRWSWPWMTMAYPGVKPFFTG